MTSPRETIQWLLASDEPWTRYRTLVDLLGRSEQDADVRAARAEMLAHTQVRDLFVQAAERPHRALKRHNDAKHPLYRLSTLVDFGLRSEDAGVAPLVEDVLAHQAAEGAFQSLLLLPKAFGGSGEEEWSWIACDAPVLLHILLGLGLRDDEQVQHALDHLIGLVGENGWPCRAAEELGGFRGPGRKGDPCPITNVIALKALSQLDALSSAGEKAARAGVDMLLWHWQHQKERKVYMFGIGTDFRKLKYPFIWYDLLHVLDVLSRYPHVHADARFSEMLHTLTEQADEDGRYTATSMYRAWKGWSFADKRTPSPWLTFLALRIQTRVQAVAEEAA